MAISQSTEILWSIKGILMGFRLSWKQEFYIPPGPSNNELTHWVRLGKTRWGILSVSLDLFGGIKSGALQKSGVL